MSQHELASYDNLLQKRLFVPPEKKRKKKEKPSLVFSQGFIGIYFAIELGLFFFGVQCSKAFFIIRHEKL